MLDNIPKGMFVVTASLQGFRVGAANAGEPLLVTAAAHVQGVKIELAPAETSLTGLVLDAVGGPINGAKVQIAPVEYSVRVGVELITDAEGRFSASMPAGQVAIRAEAPGYAPALLYRTLPTRDATLRLTPGGTIEGTVIDAATGQPVQGVDVRAVGTMAATLLAPVTSRADGSFALYGVSPGRYGLVAEGERHRGATSGALNVGFGELITGVILPVTSGVSVSGRVLIGSGEQPCTEGFVQLGPLNELSVVSRLADAEVKPRADTVPVSAVAQIDRLGQVLLRGLPSGRYYVVLQCRGHVFADGPKVIDLQEQDRNVTWRVAEGLGLVVVVKDEGGRPIPRASLSLEFPTGATGNRAVMGLSVDENGRASLPGSLYPGSYLILPDESYGVEPVPVDLTSGSGTSEVEITIPGSSSLTVQVRAPRGEPVDDVQVVARALDVDSALPIEGGARPGSTRIGIDMGMGEFRIQPLRAGNYRVEVIVGGNPPLIATGPNGQVITLQRGGDALATVNLDCEVELSGSVVDTAGAPVPDVWVTASYHRAGRAGAWSDGDLAAPDPPRVLSDAEGHFSLAGLCADARYLLRAEQDGRDVGQLSQVEPRGGVELKIQHSLDEDARLSRSNVGP